MLKKLFLAKVSTTNCGHQKLPRMPLEASHVSHIVCYKPTKEQHVFHANRTEGDLAIPDHEAGGKFAIRIYIEPIKFSSQFSSPFLQDPFTITFTIHILVSQAFLNKIVFHLLCKLHVKLKHLYLVTITFHASYRLCSSCHFFHLITIFCQKLSEFHAF